MLKPLGQLGVLSGGPGREGSFNTINILRKLVGRGARNPGRDSPSAEQYDRATALIQVVAEQAGDFFMAIEEFSYNLDVEDHQLSRDLLNPRFVFGLGELFDRNWNSIFTPQQFFDQGGTPYCGVAAVFYAWMARHPSFEYCRYVEEFVVPGSDVGSTLALSQILNFVSLGSAILAVYHKVGEQWMLTPVLPDGYCYCHTTPVVVVRFTSNSDLGIDAIDDRHGHWDCVFTSLPEPVFYVDSSTNLYSGHGSYIATAVNLATGTLLSIPLEIGFSAHGNFLPQTPAGFYALTGAGKKKNSSWSAGDERQVGKVDGGESKIDAGLRQLRGVDTRHMDRVERGETYADVAARGKGFRNKNAEHQKKVNGSRADPDDQEEREVGQRKWKSFPAARRVSERKEKEKEGIPSKYTLIILSTLSSEPQGWNGEELFDVVDASLTPLPEAFKLLPVDQHRFVVGSSSGLVLPCRTEFEKIDHVVSMKPGYCIVDLENGDKTVIGRGCYERYEFDEVFVYNGLEYDRCAYVFFEPFMQFLKTRLSTSVFSETHRNAAFSAVNRHFPGFTNDALVSTTISAYIHYNAFRLFRMQTGYGAYVVEHRDRLVDSEMVKYGEVKIEGNVAFYGSVDCPVPDDYPFRDDCALVFQEDRNNRDLNVRVFTSAYEEAMGAEWEYPRFLTSQVGANSNKFYRSTFVGFWPEDAAPFLTYSVNAVNACKALKRMCGARESREFDKTLTSLQYSAFGYLLLSEGTRWEPADDSYDAREHWRDKFLKIARLEITGVGECGKLFSGFKVGSQEICNRINGYEDTRNLFEEDEPAPRFKRAFYPNPAYKSSYFFHIGLPGICEPIMRMDTHEDVILEWFSAHCPLQKIHEQMERGLNSLFLDFNKHTLSLYALDHPNWIYKRNLENFTTFLSYRECREELSLITHVKKALRMMFVNREVDHTPENNMTRFVEARVKKEFAKQGKVPRLYVTYDAGCMYANELPEWMKVCLNGVRTFYHDGITAHIHIFAKPTSDALRGAMSSLIDCMCRRDEVYILIYSDDSCWTGNINGVPFAFNVDISSCDSGNKGGVFGIVFMLLAHFSPELAAGLCSQCANPIKLANPEDPDELCEIYMHSLFEGSGTVLTTILNHVAMYMVAQAALVLFSSLRSSLNTWEEVSLVVVKAGQSFGHVLSVEPARDSLGFCPEKIQFLKRSPLRLTSGEYVPVLNYGTIFRGFGSIEGDLTADMVGMSAVEFSQLKADKRCEMFLSGVVAGLKNEPNSIVLSALRRRFALLPGSKAGVWENMDLSKFSLQTSKLLGEDLGSVSIGGDIDNESLCRRYGLSPCDLSALAGKIENSRIGFLYPDRCVGAFASVDYGCKMD